MAEISTKVGEDSNVCSTYLKNLIALGVIRKEVPYGEKTTRKTIYSIEDNMFRFWYRFVPENRLIIARGAGTFTGGFEPHLSRLYGTYF